VAGTAGVEVESVVRIASTLRSTHLPTISDPSLLAITQLTVEIDQLLFPLNKSSTKSEPQTWFGALSGQDIPQEVINYLRQWQSLTYSGTLRAKKTVAALQWISGRPLAEMEQVLLQFGGGADSAAGPIRALTSRMCDLLPTVGRIAEILCPELVLGERITRLLARLEAGVPAAAAELAELCGPRLDRSDYLRLVKAELVAWNALDTADDADLLEYVGGDETKIAELRRALAVYKQRQITPQPLGPILEPYQP
jgi:hypothetical protein